MNINRKILIFGIIFIFFVFAFGKSFLTAQLAEIEGISSEDYSYQGENAEVRGEVIACKEGFDNCKVQISSKTGIINLELTQGTKYDPASGKISVIESDASFKIGGETFSNIESGNIVINQNTGEISQAKFTTNANGGNYNINGIQFSVLGNKEFIYPTKEGGYKFPDGTTISKVQPGIRIESEGIIDYKGNKISSVLNFDKDGNAFLKIREKAVINGVLVENSVPKSYGGSGKGDELRVFFDKNLPELKNYDEYLVLDIENNYVKYTNQKVGPRISGKQVRATFMEDNLFYGDITTEKDYLGFIAESGAKGAITITRPFDLPILEVKDAQRITLLEDAAALSFSDEISISQNNIGKLGTIPMRIEFKDKQVAGLIPDEEWTKELGLTEEAGRYFLWSGKEELVKSSFGGTGVGGIAQIGEAEKEELKKWVDGAEVKIDNSKNVWGMTNDPNFAKSLKDSRSAASFLENIYNNKEIGLSEVIEKTAGSQNIGAIQNLQNDLKAKKITQNDFYNQIDSLNKQGVDTDIKFSELEKTIGLKNTQNLKENIGKRMESYFSYYQHTGDSTYLLRVAGQNEIDAINNCVGRGNNFRDCFNQNYNFYGAKTDLCIKSREYCPVLDAGELFRIGF